MDERHEIKYENAIKEDFCGACLALPLAFAGAGTATATSGSTSYFRSKIFFWSKVITIVGLIGYWYYKRTCKSCNYSNSVCRRR